MAEVELSKEELFAELQILRQRVRAYEGQMSASADSEQRYQSFARAAFEGIVITRKGVILDANEQLNELLGYGVDGLVGHSVLEFIPEHAFQRTAEYIGEGSDSPFETSIRTKDGREIPIEVRGKSIAYEGDRALVAVIRDLTERKEAERLIRESEAQYRLLADHVHDVIWKTDFTGKYTYVSPSIERILGFTVEEAMALTSDQVVTPESQKILMKALSGALQASSEGGNDITGPRTLVYEAYCKDGSTKWLEAQVSLLLDENGKPSEILGVTRDITYRKKVEDEREKLISELQGLLGKVKTLSGLLPICARCKKIRDDSGYWSQIETYVRDHSEAEFTHSYCPDCAESIMANHKPDNSP